MVGADHPVRVIDAFVDTLDLKALGFSKVAAEATGRPPYLPGDLLKLYVYGYVNQVRSSRRLERKPMRNIEVQWLINRVSPWFKTIADFRKDHAAAIVGVWRTFMRFCRGQSLYGGELLAIDGTKVEAVASRETVITPKNLEKQIESIDAEDRRVSGGHGRGRSEEARRSRAGGRRRGVGRPCEKRDELQGQAKALARRV